jgi:hypothetical protein
MKKYLFFAVAACMLAACSTDETVSEVATQQEALSFSGSVSNMTRSIGLVSRIDQVESMNVWCDINEAGATKKYFSDTFNRTNAGYVSAKSYYWLSDISDAKTMTFTAFHNAVQTASGTLTDFAPEASAGVQKDVLVAQHVSTKKESPSVKLNFRHILSQIDVKVRNTNPLLKGTVSGIRIGYVKTASSKFQYSGGVTDAIDAVNVAQSDWTLVDFATPAANETMAEKYKYEQAVTWSTDDNQGNFVTPAKHLGGFTPWILLPQNMKKFDKNDKGEKIYAHSFAELLKDQQGNALPDVTGSYIGLKVTITYVNEGEETVIIPNQWVYWPIDELTDWNPGNKYTYVIDINSGWYPTPPEPGPEPGPGPLVPVFENIKFSPDCTVDAWDDGGTYDVF